MKPSTVACIAITALQTTLANPISLVRRYDAIVFPAEDDMFNIISISERIASAAAKASNSTDTIDATKSAFSNIYNLMSTNASSSSLDSSALTIDIPIIDDIICWLTSCRPGIQASSAFSNTTDSPPSSIPPILDQASALAELAGWTDGSIPINSVSPIEIDTSQTTIPPDAVSCFVAAIANAALTYKKLSGNAPWLPLGWWIWKKRIIFLVILSAEEAMTLAMGA